MINKEVNINELLNRIKILENELEKSKKIQNALVKRLEEVYSLKENEFNFFATNALINELIEKKNKEILIETEKLLKEKIIYQESFYQSEERLNTIINSLDDVVWSASYPELNLLFANRSIESTFEFSMEDFYKYPQLWLDIIHPDDKIHLLKKIELAKNGEPQETVYRTMLPSGKICWIRNRFRMVFSEDGTPIRLDGIASDFTFQREAELKLLESEHKFRTLADYTFDWEFWLDPNNHFVYISPSCERITGYSSDEFITNPDLLVNIVHPDDYDFFNNLLINNELNQIYDCEIRIKRKDGQIRYIQHISRPIYDSKGNFLGRRISNRDITEKKLAEIDLNRQKKLIESILDNAPIFIWLNDPEGNTIFENLLMRISTKIQGVSSFKESELEELRTTDLKAMQSDEQIEYVHEVTFNDGSKHFLQTVKSRMVDDNGNTIGVLGLALDITQNKLSEQKLNEIYKLNSIINELSSVLIQSTTENIHDGILFALEILGRFSSADRVYIFTIHEQSKHIENTYNWLSENITSQLDAISLIRYETIERWIEIFKNNDYIYFRNTAEIPDGYPIEKETFARTGIISLLGIPMFYGKDLIGMIVFDTLKEERDWDFDIVSLLRLAAEIIAGAIARNKFELEIIKQKQIADQANRAKSEFLANMSHEIRTPMNAILGFSEIMLNSIREQPYRGYLETIQKSGRTLLALINDILDLSKIEAGRIELQPEPVNIAEVLNDIYQIFYEQARSKNLELELKIQDNPPDNLYIDEVRLRQVLINLVGNAIKFTKVGGVYISMEHNKIDNQHFNIRIDVRDTGIGISSEDKEVIFESFRQASSVSVKHFGGTGLGLAISSRLAKMMGGEITVDSELGKGSTFSVKLYNVQRLHSVKKASEQIDWSKKKLDFKGSKILIIDDIQQNIDLVKVYLENTNIIIAEANNGRQGIEMIRSFEPNLVLMDLRMPELSGYQTRSIIRDELNIKHIPIIAFTASSMKEDEIRITNQFNGLIRKPVNRNELINELIKFLDFSVSEIEETKEIADEDLTGEELISRINDNILEEFKSLFQNDLESLAKYTDLQEAEDFINKLKAFAINNNEDNLMKIQLKLSNYFDNFEIDKFTKTINEIYNYLSNK